MRSFVHSLHRPSHTFLFNSSLPHPQPGICPPSLTALLSFQIACLYRQIRFPNRRIPSPNPLGMTICEHTLGQTSKVVFEHRLRIRDQSFRNQRRIGSSLPSQRSGMTLLQPRKRIKKQVKTYATQLEHAIAQNVGQER